MRLLCVAAQHDPIGYVAVNGRPLGCQEISRLTGVSINECESLLQELDKNGVFSRDRKQRIYSRRMLRDVKKHATAKKNGKGGGNPSLLKERGNSASDNPSDKAGDKPQIPLTNTQIPKVRTCDSVLSVGRVLLKTETFEKAREIAPRWDVYVLEQQWREWAGDKINDARKPDQAFLAFVRKHIKGKTI